jgi:hypothetical protein
MRYLDLLFVALASLLPTMAIADVKVDSASSVVAVAETQIEIIAPLDGATLLLNAANTLKYDIILRGEDDHAYVYLDDQKIQLLRRMQGEYPLEKPPLGYHQVCIKMAYKDHSLTGLQRCIKVKIVPTPSWRAD